MTQFIDAITTLKKSIDKIGGKTFSFKKQWLDTLEISPRDNYLTTPPADYSNNILQTLWNIVDVFQTATNSMASTFFLFNHRLALRKWFHYLEPVTGTPLIYDEQTYQLGSALRDFLEITTNDEQAKNLLSIENTFAKAVAKEMQIQDPIEKLKTSLKLLTERLAHYEAHVAAKHALAAYRQNIQVTLTAQLEWLVPEYIYMDGNRLGYHITLSNADDPIARADENKRSYTILIDQLKAYAQQLAGKERNVSNAYENFERLHPLPTEAITKYQSEFLNLRRDACNQLESQHKKITQQQLYVVTLLNKAKSALQAINNRLSQGSQAERDIQLRLIKERVEDTSSRAEKSLEKYRSAKSAADKLTSAVQELLTKKQEIANAAKKRRDFLTEATDAINMFLTGTSDIPPRRPSATTLTPYLDYKDNGVVDLINTLCMSLPAEGDQASQTGSDQASQVDSDQVSQTESERSQSVKKTNGLGSALKKMLTRLTKERTPPHLTNTVSEQSVPAKKKGLLTFMSRRSIAQLPKEIDTQQSTTEELLLAQLRNKQVEIAAELAIDSLRPVTSASSSIESGGNNTLYALQNQYQQILDAESAIEQQRQLLIAAEQQSRKDALARKQALVVLLLTTLQFRLKDIEPQKKSLQILLHELTLKTPEEALAHIEENNDSITKVREWFDIKIEETQLSSHELLDRLIPQWQEIKKSYANPDGPTQTDLVEQETTLLQEFKTLEPSIAAANEQYQELQQLINTLTAAEKTAHQLKELNTIITECNNVIIRCSSKDSASTAEITQLIADVTQQLQTIAARADFLAQVEASQTPGSIEKLANISTYRALLSNYEKELSQLLVIKPSPPQEKPKTLLRAGCLDTEHKKIFDDYLEERANTFRFKDLVSQFISLIFGCSGYKTEAQKRQEYITELQTSVTTYQTHPETYADLEAVINRGLQAFPPRASEGPEYQKSLRAKLTALQVAIHATHLPQQSQDTPTLTQRVA